MAAAVTFIGVDLGGTHLRAGRVDGQGKLLSSQRTNTDAAGGPGAVIEQIETLVKSQWADDVAGIGIGVPGAFDAASGTVLGIPALPGWTGIPLAAKLRDRLGVPCHLENDAKVAAIGEWHGGAAQGARNFVYVTVSTGIGSCAVIDGRLLRGVGGLAGEIGHTRISDSPVRCACGRTGCWQAVAAGSALDRTAAAAVASGMAPRLAEITRGRKATAADVGVGAREGDAICLAMIDAHAVLLGYGFTNLQHVYAPELFVVGGGLSAMFDLWRGGVERTLRERLLAGFKPADFTVAMLGDDAGIVGAAGIARDAHMGS